MSLRVMVTGTISDLKLPASIACLHFFCDSRAKASCSFLAMWYLQRVKVFIKGIEHHPISDQGPYLSIRCVKCTHIWSWDLTSLILGHILDKKMPGYIIHRDIKVVGQEPNRRRLNCEYQKSLPASFLIHGTGRRNGTYRSILLNATISQSGEKFP